MPREEELPERLAVRLRELHEARLRRSSRRSTTTAATAPDAGAEIRMRRSLVEAQRRQLSELRREGLPADVARELQRDLDLEESRLGRS